jgi:YD repeat-containing protein
LGSTTNYYNHQGLLTVVSNAYGRVQWVQYDRLDHETNRVDAAGVAVAQTCDYMGHVLTKTYPGSGIEKYSYSFYGVTAYTNRRGARPTR